MLKRILSAAALTLAAVAVQAADITITGIRGTWSNPTGAAVVLDGQGTGETKASWGTPATPGGQVSSYSFLASPVPLVVPAPSSPFVFGSFFHENFPIFVPSLSSIDLSIAADLAGIGTVVSTFRFNHEETVNAPPCAYPVPAGPPCNDRVTLVSQNTPQAEFTLDGQKYVFDVLGFRIGGEFGQDFAEFITSENALNEALLVAEIRAVPEPAPLALAGTGLLALGFVGRRRKQVQE